MRHATLLQASVSSAEHVTMDARPSCATSLVPLAAFAPANARAMPRVRVLCARACAAEAAALPRRLRADTVRRSVQPCFSAGCAQMCRCVLPARAPQALAACWHALHSQSARLTSSMCVCRRRPDRMDSRAWCCGQSDPALDPLCSGHARFSALRGRVWKLHEARARFPNEAHLCGSSCALRLLCGVAWLSHFRGSLSTSGYSVSFGAVCG